MLIRKGSQQHAQRAAFILSSTRSCQITLFLQTLIGISDTCGWAFFLSVNNKAVISFIQVLLVIAPAVFLVWCRRITMCVHALWGRAQEVFTCMYIPDLIYPHCNMREVDRHMHLRPAQTPRRPQEPFLQRLIVCFSHPQTAREPLWC